MANDLAYARLHATYARLRSAAVRRGDHQLEHRLMLRFWREVAR